MKTAQTLKGPRFLGFNEYCAGSKITKDDCYRSRTVVRLGIHAGANMLNSSGGAMFSGANAFSAEDIKSMQEIASTRWTCESSGKTADPRICGASIPCDLPSLCGFKIPAKRVNVYPDEVEAVWFDNKEVDNAAYAMWVAAHGSEETIGALKELCTWREPPPVFGTTFDDTKFRQRQFVSWNLGYDYVDF